MPPPPAPPSNAFEALSAKSGTKPGATPQASAGTSAPATGGPDAEKPAKAVDPDLLAEFKKAVLANQKLSKMAIVEVLSVQIDGLTKADAKVMLDQVAERRGPGRTKVWELKDDQ